MICEFTNKLSCIFISLGLVLADQISKYIIRAYSGFYICNKGIAFGIDFHWMLLIVFSILMFFFIIKLISNCQLPSFNKNHHIQFQILNSKHLNIRHFIRNWKLEISNFNKYTIFAIILISSGGLSNIIERLTLGCVIDFIDLKFWPVFNLADIFITIGGIIIMKHITHNIKHTT